MNKIFLFLILLSEHPIKAAPLAGKIDPVAASEIALANQAWFPALKNHDAVEIAKAYKADGVFVTPDGKSVAGKAAIEKMYAERLQRPGKYLKGEVNQEGTAMVQGRVYEWGSAWLEFADPLGKVTQRGGPYLTVWEKQVDGHWYISRNLAL